MLSIALAATLVGFALLVVALVTSNLVLAIACVVVCAVGLILLLVDTLRANRRGRGGPDDEPLFTIRGHESATREEPLEGEDSDEAAVVAERDGPEAPGGPLAPADPGRTAPPTGGLGSVIAPPTERFDDHRAGGAETPSNGDVNDYLRSTGSFPVPRGVPQSGSMQSGSVPSGPMPTGPVPSGPVPPENPQPTDPSGPYVGRRRLGGDPTENIVIRSSEPDLPAMQFVWEEPGTGESTGYTGGAPEGEGGPGEDRRR